MKTESGKELNVDELSSMLVESIVSHKHNRDRVLNEKRSDKKDERSKLEHKSLPR